MLVIGITGGVGAGKSSVLQYIGQRCKCRIVLADEVGNRVKLPGEICYNRLVELMGSDILDEKGYIDKLRMAEAIFSDKDLLTKVNAIIHPQSVMLCLIYLCSVLTFQRMHLNLRSREKATFPALSEVFSIFPSRTHRLIAF